MHLRFALAVLGEVILVDQAPLARLPVKVRAGIGCYHREIGDVQRQFPAHRYQRLDVLVGIVQVADDMAGPDQDAVRLEYLARTMDILDARLLVHPVQSSLRRGLDADEHDSHVGAGHLRHHLGMPDYRVDPGEN